MAFTGAYSIMASKKPDWQKMSVYVASLIGFMTVIFYIIDIKVAVAKLEVKVEKLEGK
jgi:hypothetical protein